MSKRVADIPGPGRFARGVHPAGFKRFSENAAIEVLPTPAELRVPLLQHTGAPSVPVVKMKDAVAFGQLLAEAKGMISAATHSPVAGTVGKETVTTLPNARHVRVIPITPAADTLSGAALYNEILGGEWPSGDEMREHSPDAIIEAIRAAGIVGQGGAAFPTAVKFARNPQKPVDTILVNGCECEPYLTSDYRLMLEAPAAVVCGARLAARAAGADHVYIALESNKPAAAEALREKVKGTPVRVAEVETKYPMGGEKQTVRAVLGRTIPTGGLPLDVGVVVINAATAAAIARAVVRKGALTHRVVSVTGGAIARPKNVLAPIGASYAELIEFCGGLTPAAGRVISGGPMMGLPLGNFQIPITKGASGIVALTADDVRAAEETNCVRCGRCVDVCPLNLVPSRIALAARHKDWSLAQRYHMQACMECGCCAFVCPAAIPLVQLIRMGKPQMLRETQKAGA
ncbi:MAG: electron transport complex subunit RsxC [Kiritimatiellae bacterium]|nr:electron transport complex subunit RsxC [Kiritimatiellia bacterium]